MDTCCVTKTREEGHREARASMIKWWERVVVFPARRVWIGVATRLGIRRTGLRKLRKEVRSCDYEDVHVMWELLRKADTEIGGRPFGCRAIQRGRRRWRRGGGELWASLCHWAPCNLCRNL
ncbi:unnamed protein product [Musa banksii]